MVHKNTTNNFQFISIKIKYKVSTAKYDNRIY